jgi:hypothetical protein
MVLHDARPGRAAARCGRSRSSRWRTACTISSASGRTYGFGFFRDQCAVDPEKYHTPVLAAVWYEKKEFVKRAIEMVRLNRREDVVDRVPFIWCDAGCVRTDAWLPKVRSFGTGLLRRLVSTQINADPNSGRSLQNGPYVSVLFNFDPNLDRF